MYRSNYWLNRQLVLSILDQHHLLQRELAAELKISAPQLSRLLSGARPVSPQVRRRFLGHPRFTGLEERLWTIEGDMA